MIVIEVIVSDSSVLLIYFNFYNKNVIRRKEEYI